MMSVRALLLSVVLGGMLITRTATAQRQDRESVALDTGRSVVRWKGTKFRGRGKHEGTLLLTSGFVSMCRTTVCGGRFVLDMRSIAVTDIPVDDEVPRT